MSRIDLLRDSVRSVLPRTALAACTKRSDVDAPPHRPGYCMGLRLTSVCRASAVSKIEIACTCDSDSSMDGPCDDVGHFTLFHFSP